MKSFKTQAHINSLNGALKEITIIEPLYMFGYKVPNMYVGIYNGIKCSVLHNQYNFEYYADDLFGRID